MKFDAQEARSLNKLKRVDVDGFDEPNLDDDSNQSHTQTLEKGTSTNRDESSPAATPTLIQNVDYRIRRALSPLSPRSQSQITKWKQSPRMCSNILSPNNNSAASMLKRQSPTNHFIVYPLPDASLVNFNRLHRKNFS